MGYDSTFWEPPFFVQRFEETLYLLRTDTQVIDTQVIDTQVIDTQVIDTQVIDTQTGFSIR